MLGSQQLNLFDLFAGQKIWAGIHVFQYSYSFTNFLTWNVLKTCILSPTVPPPKRKNIT